TFFRNYRLYNNVVWCGHYANTSSTFLTASWVMIKESYLNMSYTFKELTNVVCTLGIFLADLITFSSLSFITIRAFLLALIFSSIFTISLVFGSFRLNSSRTIILLSTTFEV